MIHPIDVEGCLREVAEARRTQDEGKVRLADALADGFRRDLDSLDMETAGVALVIAGISMFALLQEHRGIRPHDLAEILAMAGENLARIARARAVEAGDELLADLEARFMESLGKPSVLLPSGPKHEEFVLTWHPLNGAPPVEIPLRTHWVFPGESCGEFVVSTREVPPPADEPVSDDDVWCPHPACHDRPHVDGTHSDEFGNPFRSTAPEVSGG